MSAFEWMVRHRNSILLLCGKHGEKLIPKQSSKDPQQIGYNGTGEGSEDWGEERENGNRYKPWMLSLHFFFFFNW